MNFVFVCGSLQTEGSSNTELSPHTSALFIPLFQEHHLQTGDHRAKALLTSKEPCTSIESSKSSYGQIFPLTLWPIRIEVQKSFHQAELKCLGFYKVIEQGKFMKLGWRRCREPLTGEGCLALELGKCNTEVND